MAQVLLTLLVLAFIVVCESTHPAQHRNARVNAKQLEMERLETCMEDLGCFSIASPWDFAPYSPLPSERDDIGTEFRFYAPGKAVETIKSQAFAVPAGFDARLNTKFIIHGYQAGNAPWAVETKDAFQKREPCNVFIVDWSNGAGGRYSKAIANTRVVGAETGLFIHKLEDATNLNVSKVHLVGHSLGAHTAGYAGKWVRDKLNRKVGRITGMDTAGWGYDLAVPLVILDIGDAEFVDAIHTDDYWGMANPVGHFDFYPNGGQMQPGCGPRSWYLYRSSNDDDTCSHSRAHQLFLASLQEENCGFYARECSSWDDYTNGECNTDKNKRVQMGYDADKYKDLIDPENHILFYLKTSAKKNFCLDQKE